MVIDPAWREEVDASEALLPVGVALPPARFVHDPRPLRTLEVDMERLAHRQTPFAHDPARGIGFLARQLELLRTVKEQKLRAPQPPPHARTPAAGPSAGPSAGLSAGGGAGGGAVGEWLRLGGKGLVREFMRVNPGVGWAEAVEFLAGVV